MFPFAFKIFDKTDVEVVRTDSNAGGAETVLVLDSDYSVALNADQNSNPGGTITYPASGANLLSSTQQITTIGSLAYLQPTDITNSGGFYPSIIEDALDRDVILIQQLDEIVSRAIVLPITEQNPPELPPAAQRANSIFGFDALGNLELLPITTSVGAGDLTDEIFVNGVDFTAGTTLTLTLGRAYSSESNIAVHFDGTFQGPDQYSLNGHVLTFSTPISLGTTRVYVKGGTTLSIYKPALGSVGDNELAWGNVLTRVLGSVTALQNIDVTRYQRASTNAYYAGGQGAADYYYDPTYPQASANGGSAIASLNGIGCWRIIPRGVMNLFQWGAKGDDVADDTAAIQAAVTWQATTGAPIVANSVSATQAYRTTAPITATGTIKITGEGCELFKGAAGTNVNARGPGSWFHFDHAGRGFSVNDTNLTLVSATFERIGTIRNQPTPNGATAWTPAANDFDFYLFNCETVMRDFVTLNPTKGVMVTMGAAAQSRTTINGWRGQPLSIGFQVEASADVVKTNDLHFWPFWSFAVGVTNYMLANAIAYKSGRNDNPMLSNIFAYSYAFGVNVYQAALGSTSKLSATNVDFDSVGLASFYIGAGVSSFIGYLSNWVAQGSSTSTSGGIVFESGSSGNELLLNNVDMGNFQGSAIFVGGTANNVVRMSNTRLYSYNLGNGGSPAVNATANNFVYADSKTCEFGAPGFGALPFGSTGNIAMSDAASGSFSGSTDSGGVITIPHNLGHTPTRWGAGVVNSAAALIAQPIAATQTTITFKVFTTSTGSGLVSAAITLLWTASL